MGRLGRGILIAALAPTLSLELACRSSHRDAQNNVARGEMVATIEGRSAQISYTVGLVATDTPTLSAPSYGIGVEGEGLSIGAFSLVDEPYAFKIQSIKRNVRGALRSCIIPDVEVPEAKITRCDSDDVGYAFPILNTVMDSYRNNPHR